MHSQTENKELMAQGWNSFTRHWGIGIGATLVSSLILSSLQNIPYIGSILYILFFGVFEFGVATINLAIARGENPQISQVFSGFSLFLKTLFTFLIQTLFIILWTLLLIIPGIIATYSYAMTFYILADNPSIKPLEAITKSETMMEGNKAKLFFLTLRFMLWVIIPIVLLGIVFALILPHAGTLIVKVLVAMLFIAMIVGMFVFMSYMGITLAKFYDDLKKNQLSQEVSEV